MQLLLASAISLIAYANSCGSGGGTVPTPVPPAPIGAQHVALGSNWGCAVVKPTTGPRNLQCWGAGQGLKTWPVGGEPVSYAAGWYYGCRIDAGGKTYCNGRNEEGQLGLGYASEFEVTAKQVDSDAQFVATRMGAGFSTCGLEQDTSLWCWGDNAFGAVGNGGEGNVLSPVQIDDGVVDVAVGYQAACAVYGDGTLKCWGTPEVLGVMNSTPTPFAIEGKAKQVVMNNRHSCALLEDGRVRCWGRNGFLGNGAPFDWSHQYVPQLVTGLDDVVQLAAGRSNVCAVKADGTVWCWGNAHAGQMGIAGFTQPSALVPVKAEIEDAKFIAVGTDNACAINSAGRLFCWGSNAAGAAGQLGAGVVDTPTEVPIVF